MEILSFIFEFIYVGFIAVCLVGASILLYDYFLERKARKSEAEQEKCDSEACESPEFIITRETQIIESLSGVICDMYDISSAIKSLNNPNLDYSLEELNSAAEDVLKAIQYVYDLNYPIDEEELNK